MRIFSFAVIVSIMIGCTPTTHSDEHVPYHIGDDNPPTVTVAPISPPNVRENAIPINTSPTTHSTHLDDGHSGNVLLFQEADGFHAFASCGSGNYDCMRSVFARYGAVHVANGTEVGFVDAHVFGPSKIIIRSGPHSGEEMYVPTEWVKGKS
jgi:hypothetical protein